MIKAVIFDAGGVIVSMGSQLDEFVKIFKPKNREKFWKKINDYVGSLSSGEITEQKYWERIAKSENINIRNVPSNLWETNYEKGTKINKDIISLIKNLRKKYKTILLSNTIEPHVRINKKRRLFDSFDDVINSNEVHLSKNTTKIFKLALDRNKLKPEESVFIDDIQNFLDIAKSIGIKGILFKDVGQLKKELNNLGINGF
jgi:putative hydrolase of the HAD superfamily